MRQGFPKLTLESQFCFITLAAIITIEQMLENGRNILFAGDTLFQNSIGRTDLWGGSMPQILSSIHGKLLTLDDDTLVIAGHGPSTTVGNERRNNPFLR